VVRLRDLVCFCLCGVEADKAVAFAVEDRSLLSARAPDKLFDALPRGSLDRP
jgi:hypothetical protein